MIAMREEVFYCLLKLLTPIGGIFCGTREQKRLSPSLYPLFHTNHYPRLWIMCITLLITNENKLSRVVLYV
jgi:hypothetical protein